MLTVIIDDDKFIHLIQQLRRDINNASGLDKMALQSIYSDLMKGVFVNEHEKSDNGK